MLYIDRLGPLGSLTGIRMLSQVASAPLSRPVWQARPGAAGAEINSGWSVIAVAATVIIMAFSGLFGIVPILLFYALWLPLLSGWRGIVRGLKQNILPVLVMALCLLSVAWSAYRSISLHNALEAASMLLCTLIIAQRTSLPAFLKGLNLGVTVVLLATLVSGNYAQDTFSGLYSLVGLFGSKNLVGLFAEIGCLGALLYFCTVKNWIGRFIYALVPLAISLVCLYMCKSAGSVASLALVLVACGTVWLLLRLPRRVQSAAMLIFAFITIVVLAVGIAAGWQKLGLSLFGKDTTLTGRTYLWAEGVKVGLEHPWLGHGYSAFWVPGQPQAERYWFEFFIPTRTGFHFHNMYVQSFVDLGIGGTLLFVLMYLGNCVRSFRYLRRHGADLTGFFALGLSVMFLIRSMVEVDLLSAFGIGQLLFYSIVPRLNRQQAASTAQIALPVAATRPAA